MTPIPAFYYRRALPDDRAVLAEGDGFLVIRHEDLVALECFTPWQSEFDELYRRHNAKGVTINLTTSAWKGHSFDFLRDLPDLRHLRLGVDIAMDVALLGDLERLETLGLDWRAPGSPGLIDFRRLKRLKECSICWHPAFASILELESLRILFVHDARGLKELDLTGLPRLVELGLVDCAALMRIIWREGSRLLALELANCGKLQPDWSRIAPDLQYLCLRGRIGFPVEETTRAGALRFLWTQLPSRLSSDVLHVVQHLPHLEGVTLIDLRVSKDVARQIRAINEAKGHGPSLSVQPPRQVLADD
jgi:hypothetical protein